MNSTSVINDSNNPTNVAPTRMIYGTASHIDPQDYVWPYPRLEYQYNVAETHRSF